MSIYYCFFTVSQHWPNSIRQRSKSQLVFSICELFLECDPHFFSFVVLSFLGGSVLFKDVVSQGGCFADSLQETDGGSTRYPKSRTTEHDESSCVPLQESTRR